MCVRKCLPISEFNQIKALIFVVPKQQAQVFSGVISTNSCSNKQMFVSKMNT